LRELITLGGSLFGPTLGYKACFMFCCGGAGPLLGKLLVCAEPLLSLFSSFFIAFALYIF
jgi:hypothetical protein